MKKVITVIAIALALGAIALFILHLRQEPASETRPNAPTGETEQTIPTTGDAPGESTAAEAPEYTFPEDAPQPTGTQPQDQDGSDDASVPTAAPGLDEDETPHMEV